MNKLTAEKCREQFEKWASNDGAFPRAIEKQDGEYILLATQSQWTVWLASRAALEIALPILEQQELGEGDWIDWKGGDQPVSDYSVVEVKFRNGSVEKGEFAECYEWNHGYHDLSTTEVDIIAYRSIPERPTNQNGEQ